MANTYAVALIVYISSGEQMIQGSWVLVGAGKIGAQTIQMDHLAYLGVQWGL